MKLNITKYKNFVTNILTNAHRASIDLGSDTTRIGLHQKGIVLKEPSFIGYNSRSNQYLFYGREAKDIYGKAPNFIKVIKPIDHAIISDFDGVVFMLNQFIKKSILPYFNNSLIRQKIPCYSVIPTTATEVEQRALVEALLKTHFNKVFLVEKPIAFAIGVGHQISTNKPVFTIDFGAGMVEMAVIIMGGILSSKAIKTGGHHMDKTLKNYLHLKYGLIIGNQTAERLKKSLLDFESTSKTQIIRGKSLENGLPKSVKVSSGDVKEALYPVINNICDSLKEFIETIPPETVDSILKNGIILGGGGADINGIDRYLQKEIRIPVKIASKPEDITISGLNTIINHPEVHRDYFI